MRTAVVAVAEYAIYLVTAAFAVSCWRLPEPSRRVIAVQLLVATAATVALVGLAALAYHHPRPFADGQVQPWFPHDADSGFPSDHTTATTMMAALLWPYRRAVAAALMATAAMIGVARVLAHVHWPVDVVAAIGIGGTGAALGWWLGGLMMRPRRRTPAGP
ncbi:phosphatase PAP2 family protein [Micromonospora sp. NPDC002296]|uniref:phosphatase PAP2 family protein n=1 Tax=Micromonospora sp. NPDC002296 TaxID=3154271 RepID=UPI00332A5936